MPWTMSKDGVLRTNVQVKVRLDRKQLNILAKHAKAMNTTVEDVIKSEAGLSVEDLLSRIDMHCPATCPYLKEGS